MIDVHNASLTSQGVQHRVFYLDGHPSRYQPRPTGLNFDEQTGTGVFPLVIAVPRNNSLIVSLSKRRFEPRTDTGSEHFACQVIGIAQIFKLIVSTSEKILKKSEFTRAVLSLSRRRPWCELNSELKEATFLSHGRKPEVNSFPM